MRLPLAALACVLVVAGCAAPATDNPSTTSNGPGTTSAGLGTALGQLYLHNDGQRTWMDAQPSTDDVDTTIVSVPNMPGFASFPLQPKPTGPITTNGVALVRLASASPVALQPADLRVRLLVGADVVATSYEEGMDQDHELMIPFEIQAGVEITIEVCLCNSTADSYVMDTADSTVTIAGRGSPSGGAGSGNMTQGEVMVRQQGDQWIAERTDSAPVPVVDGKATIVMSSVNGAVEQQAGSAAVGLRARLIGRGDTEAEARDRLSRIYVTLSITTDSGLSLEAHGRSKDTGSNAWNTKEASLVLTLPASVAMSSALLETTNGPVTSQGFAVDDLTSKTTNGPVTASGTFSRWTAETTSGPITGDARPPSASGRFQLDTTHGPIHLTLRQTDATGIDATGETTNGEVELEFDGAQPQGTQKPTSAHVRTEGYDSKAVKTVVDLQTTNGTITASDD